VTLRDGTTESLSVNVPRLGAYAIVKANTYVKRMALSKGANPKRAKDVLYLRDLMAAGEEVKVRIQDDMRVMIRGKRQAHSYVAAARNRLEPMTRTTPELDTAAQMLAERDGVSRDAALADIKGHMADMVDLIGDVLVDA
jgi:hypothetical protein